MKNKMSYVVISFILLLFQVAGVFTFTVKNSYADSVISQDMGIWMDVFLDDNPVNSVQDGVSSSNGVDFFAAGVKLAPWRDERANTIAADSANNMIVAGYRVNAAGNQDIFVTKYNSSGIEQWTNIYNGPASGNDVATGVDVDSNNNIIVTGYTYNGSNIDFITIKYNSNGTALWSGMDGAGGIAKIYNGGGTDIANAVAVDSGNNIVVTGNTAVGANIDFYTIKYNSSGTELWHATYDNSAVTNSWDGAMAVAIDSSNNIAVTGFSQNNNVTLEDDFYTIKYNSGGNMVWQTRYTNNGFSSDANGVAIDPSSNDVVVVGNTGSADNTDFFTIKYKAADGEVVWGKIHDNGTLTSDIANSVAIDNSGNIFIAGQIKGNNSWDYGILKYNYTGAEVWNTSYDSGFTPDIAKSVAIDSGNNILVTGYVKNSSSSISDIHTIKYRSDYSVALDISRAQTGLLVSKEIIPTGTISWGQFSWQDGKPFPITATIRYTLEAWNTNSSGWETPALSDALGNSNGLFTNSPVNLSSLSFSIYTKVRLKANFISYDSSAIPNLVEWEVTWGPSSSAGPDSVAPAAVSNLAVSGPTTNSLTLTWTAPGNNGSVGTASVYDVRYSTGAINDSNWASASQATGEPIPQVSGTNQTMTVSSLASGTTYYFAIKTGDQALNISAISNIASGATQSSGSSSSSSGGSASSGGGGGGSYIIPSTVSNMSIIINNGVATTNNQSVVLTIGALKATKMAISNNSDFSGGVWEAFSTSKAWTLTSGDGIKTVYIKFQDAAGASSSAVSDSITLAASGTAASGTPPTTNIPVSSFSNGTLVKTAENAKVFLIKDQKKKWIPTAEVFETMGYVWSNIIIISAAEMDKIPFYEDTLIKASNNPKVYLVVDGIRRHIVNPEIFLDYGFKWGDIKTVSQEVINKYHPARLIRVSKQKNVYYLSGEGVKKIIPTADIFVSYNNNWEDIQVVSQKEMDFYPESNIMRYCGRLYLISGSYKKLIPTNAIFKKNKYNSALIMDANKKEFDWYKTGAAVK